MRHTFISIIAAALVFTGAAFAQDAPTTPADAAIHPPTVLMPPGPPPPWAEEHRQMFHETRKLFEELKRTNPAEYERLKNLRMTDREAFRKEIERLLPPKRREFDRRQMKLDMDCWHLAKRIQECNDEEEKSRLTKELEAKIQEMLDWTVEATKKKIDYATKQLEIIQANRDEIVRQKLNFFLTAPPPPMPPMPPKCGNAPGNASVPPEE